MDLVISVVVPVYNRANLVLRTLESVAAQTRLPTRLVVVDDGSTDDTVARVARWLKAHEHVFHARLIRQPNRGVASARNRGLAAAGNCPLVAFLDSDDRWPSDFLERTSAALAGCPAAVAASCDRENHGGPQRPVVVQDLAPLAVAPIVWMLTHGAGLASATLFRTAAVVRRGGFEPALPSGEDSALFLPLALDGPWLHAPGRPVIFDRDVTRRGDAEGNFSDKLRDNYRCWAQVYEDFIVHGGGALALAPADYRRLLGQAWYRAGRELGRGGSLLEARECYHAALAWNRWNYKTWRRLAWVWFKTGMFFRNGSAMAGEPIAFWRLSAKRPYAAAPDDGATVRQAA